MSSAHVSSSSSYGYDAPRQHSGSSPSRAPPMSTPRHSRGVPRRSKSHHDRGSHEQRPHVVTPPPSKAPSSPFSLSGLASASAAPSASWEDFDEGMLASMTRKTRRYDNNNNSNNSKYSSTGSAAAIRRNRSYDGDINSVDNDMPMDELADASRSIHRGDQGGNSASASLGSISQSRSFNMIESSPPRQIQHQTPLSSSKLQQHQHQHQQQHPPVRHSRRSMSFDASAAAGLSHNNNNNNNSNNPRPPIVPAAVDAADRGGGCVMTTPPDDISSLGVDDHQQACGRMVLALRNKAPHPTGRLSPEERNLWECIQQTLNQVRNERHSKQLCRLEESLQESRHALEEQRAEHDREVRAIQRVLADVTEGHDEERDELAKQVEELEAKVSELETEKVKLAQELESSKAMGSADRNLADSNPLLPGEDLDQLRKQAGLVTGLNKDLEITVASLEEATKISELTSKKLGEKSRLLVEAERNYKAVQVQVGKKQLEVQELAKSLDSMKQKYRSLADEKAEGENQVRALEQKLRVANENQTDMKSTSSVSSTSDDSVALKRELSETTASLENAKMIIASLQNANGSLASELRAKLRSKEDELLAVQGESADRKRRLDSLATELRDVQIKQGEIDRVTQRSNNQIFREKALVDRLHKGLTELQSASVVHEASSECGTPDSANIDTISETLNEMVVALRTTVKQTEEYIEESVEEQSAIDTDVDSEVGRHIDALIRSDREAAAKEIRQELDDKILALQHLEQTMVRKDEEIRRMKSELQSQWENDGSNESMLRKEIQSLRDQCTTNMEVLAKKERELSVLRSSLKVDEGDGGYISDDASECDDENDDGAALASLMSQSGANAAILSSSDSMEDRTVEVETLKTELDQAKSERSTLESDLRVERVSLANAKMIISSLEQANKSMMEDLRARLQESNTAIANLLEKSKACENRAAELQEEVLAVRREQEEERRKFEKEISSLRK